MYQLLLAEEGEKAVIEVDELPKIVTVADLDAKFRITALDQASTPVSSEIKKQSLVNLLPVLQSLGVQPDIIKEEIIRLFELPKSFLEKPPEPPPQAPTAEPTLPPTGQPATESGPSAEELQMLMASQGMM